METESAESTEAAVFDLELDDHELIQIIKKPIEDSKAYWGSKGKFEGKGFDLDAKRERNRRLWRGDHYDGIDMYDHNVPYIDNRIFVGVESASPIVVAQIPQIQILPSGESVTQVQLAKDIEKVMQRWAELQEFEDKMATGVRDVHLEYFAGFKMRWDEEEGKNGEIILDHVQPEDIIIDHNATLYENPRFIAHKQQMSTEEIIHKFEDKEDDVLNHLGIKQGRKTQMTALNDTWEVWFTYYDEDGVAQEAVAWLLDFDLVLGKMSNPNWNDEEEDGVSHNFFNKPQKPFFFMNVFNSGRHKVDDNAAIDQAVHQQKIVNKRGRQIVENADQSGSGIIYNTKMIGKKDMAKLIGAPDEKVGVKGNVSDAFARMSPPILPSYVVEDKYDARAEIDNFFGAHDVTQGKAQGNTATQDVLQSEKDTSRQAPLIRGVERVGLQIFRSWIQFAKVYYTAEHYFTVNGDNGEFDEIIMKSDDLEDGIDIRIVKGSTLPIDKAVNRQLVGEAAAMGYADPLTYWETMKTGILPSPNIIVERLVEWAKDPASFVQSARGEEFNREAMMDIKILNAGKMPKPRSEPSTEYINFRKNFMLSGDFIDLPQKIQKKHVQNLQQNLQNAQRILALQSTQLLDSGQEGQAVPGQAPLSPLQQQQPLSPQQQLVQQPSQADAGEQPLV